MNVMVQLPNVYSGNFRPAGIAPYFTRDSWEIISHLYMSGYSYATILTMVSVISFVHKIRNMRDLASHFMVTKLLVGVKKVIGTCDRRKPITAVMLRKFKYYIGVLWGDSYQATMLWAVFTLMFAIGLRVGEVTKLIGFNSTHFEVEGCHLEKEGRAHSWYDCTLTFF